MSGYQDSNLGPPAPKAGALTGLRYTPKLLIRYILYLTKTSGEGGIRTLGTVLPVRQFSKLLISASHPPHLLIRTTNFQNVFVTPFAKRTTKIEISINSQRLNAN